MSGRAPTLMLAVTLALCAPRLAAAQDLKDRFNVKVSLTGMYLTENADAASVATNPAAQYRLGYGDLRLLLDGRRLPGQFELHLDARVRVSGELSEPKLYVGAGAVVARGYLGGREYELREAYVRRRGEKWDFSLGRQYVVESDALKIDGVRLWYKFKKHWDWSLYAGGYPNPYSRSLTTDYQGASGYYGASIAAGTDVRYLYDKVWGSVSFTGAYLGGKNDGGALDPANPNAATPSTEGGRVYLTWNSFERFVPWLDLYHDLVLDVFGSGGVQLTRLDAFATARAGKHFTIRLGYDHLSSLAIEMFLTNLLNSRADAAYFAGVRTIQNNLILARTARDSTQLDLDAHFGLVNLFAQGRLRWRTLANAGEDPQFIDPATKDQIAAGFAWDLTVGVRDRGSLKGIRAGAWYSLLNDFRSSSHVLGIELGRSFLDERLTFDLNFLYAKTRDAAAGTMTACGAATPVAPDATGSYVGVFPAQCYGTRDGASYEPSITITAMASRHWFFLLDYRAVINQTSAAPVAAGATSTPVPNLITHVLLGRIEARY